jgi:octanoyl-[GcvH]:protein N-octanoyltransferase
MQPGFELLTDSFPDRPETGPALSRLLLDQVAAGERPPTVRLSRPGRVVAFGRRDCVSPGYSDAVAAARSRGFAGMERISGGRAAAYTEGTLSLTVTVPDRRPAEQTTARFEFASRLARSTLMDLGIDARIGEVEGEYCPGGFSVSARGRLKLVGIGQRMIPGAAHTGFVIAVTNSAAIRDVLVPVYRALGLDWDPATAGSIEDELPGAGLEEVEHALLERIRSEARLEATGLDEATHARATEMSERFRSPETGARGTGPE